MDTLTPLAQVGLVVNLGPASRPYTVPDGVDGNPGCRIAEGAAEQYDGSVDGSSGWAQVGPGEQGNYDPNPINPPPPAPRNPQPVAAPAVAALGVGDARSRTTARGEVDENQPTEREGSRKRDRDRKVVIGAAVAASVLLVGGVGVLLGRGSGPQDASLPSSQPSASVSDPGVTPSQTAVRTCWDGASLDPDSSSTCEIPTDSAAVLRVAFPVNWHRCVREGATSYNGISFYCKIRGGRVHIATYKTAEMRIGRLLDYGYPESCTSTGSGRITCGPTSKGRFVRTFDDPQILLYMSSDDPGLLDSLPQASSMEMLRGTN